MKNTSPRTMAVFIAIISAIISGITQLTLHFPESNNDILILIFSLMLIFIVIYVVVYYMLNNFMFEKVNPIYKTVQSFNISEKDLKNKLEDKNIIKEVDQEVKNWAIKKIQEIDQLKEMATYRKEFIGNVSHELKTPIFNIQGYVLTLLDGGLYDENINKKYLEKTEKSINRMISIVSDLEEITKLESGTLELNYINFNIIKLVEEIFDNQELRAKEKQVVLSFKTSKEKPVWVNADRKQIDHLITNLIVNSINYGKEGGRTEVSFMDMGENILIDIADNGNGIATEDINRIFERFYRVDRSRSRNSGGTGLGLAIVKHIVEAHNQTINVRSTVGEGTSFSFTLKKANNKN